MTTKADNKPAPRKKSQPASELSAKLRRVLPLTPKGLKLFKGHGRRQLIKDISEELPKLSMDDLAHLSALTMCIVGDANVAKGKKGGAK